MVVLIVGISLGGYIAYKLFGARAGAVLGGVIGGLVSSTATTVSYAPRTGSDAALASLSAFVSVTASCIAVVRVLIEIAAVAPSRFAAMAWPIVAMLLVCALLALGFYFPGRNTPPRCRNRRIPRNSNRPSFSARSMPSSSSQSPPQSSISDLPDFTSSPSCRV